MTQQQSRALISFVSVLLTNDISISAAMLQQLRKKSIQRADGAQP